MELYVVVVLIVLVVAYAMTRVSNKDTKEACGTGDYQEYMMAPEYYDLEEQVDKRIDHERKRYRIDISEAQERKWCSARGHRDGKTPRGKTLGDKRKTSRYASVEDLDIDRLRKEVISNA